MRVLLLLLLPLVHSTVSPYATTCSSISSAAFAKHKGALAECNRVCDAGGDVEGFGQLAETMCNTALEDFSRDCPPPSSDSTSESAEYDSAITSLESMLDANLQNIYLRLLRNYSSQAIAKYKAQSADSLSSTAIEAAEELFTTKANAATRPSGDWSYVSERKSLRSHLNDLSSSSKRLTDFQLKAAREQSQAMQFLQMQQQQLQQVQMQLYGANSPWNFGFAYRIPDSNVNLSGQYQQGKGNVQLSCVPDDYAAMLGPNGFTNGVGPGNLGLSVNLSV